MRKCLNAICTFIAQQFINKCEYQTLSPIKRSMIMEIKNKVEFYNINKKWVLFALALVSLKDHLGLDQDKVLNIIDLMVVVRVSMSWFFYIVAFSFDPNLTTLLALLALLLSNFFLLKYKNAMQKGLKKWEGNQKSGVKKAKQAKEPPSPHRATCCQSSFYGPSSSSHGWEELI